MANTNIENVESNNNNIADIVGCFEKIFLGVCSKLNLKKLEEGDIKLIICKF